MWGQRQRWPIPGAVRNIVARTISRSLPADLSRPDEWPRPLIVDVQGDTTHSPKTSAAADEAIVLPASRRDSPWPDTPRQLRCMVATGTLNLGGLEIVALFLARGLPSHGLDTVLAHTPLAHSGERPADSLRLDGVPLVTLHEHDVRLWLETHRPDIVSMHDPPDWLVTAAAEARIPTIETLHGLHFLFDEDTWRGEQRRSQEITGFVAVSELVRRQYLKAVAGYPPERIVTIPCGVDNRHIISRDRSEARRWLGLGNEFVFVSLARYALVKNTFGLVTAFSDVAHAYPEARLLLAGGIFEPHYFEQVRRLRNSLRCASQIHLHGPSPDVSTLLAAADAFVLDSFFEAGPLASMEALCAGLPVVLSDVGWAREQVGENRRRGFVVNNPLGDPDAVDLPAMTRARFTSQTNRTALVEAMCGLVAERDHWRQAREELKAESTNRFSLDVCLQRHAEVLKRATVNVSASVRLKATRSD